MEDRVGIYLKNRSILRTNDITIVTLLLCVLLFVLSACSGTDVNNTVPGPVGPNTNNTTPVTHSHSFVDTVLKEPSCEEPGLMKRECTVCGDVFEEDIPPTGHDMYIKEQSESKCTDESYRIFACKNCDHEVTETLPPAYDAHDYQPNIVTEPSCTQAGLVEYVCSRCGDNFFESISKLPHEYVEVSSIKSVCNVCGQECSYPSTLGFEGVQQLYDDMREALIASTPEKDLAKADKTIGLMWVDYSTYYDSTDDAKKGLVIIVRAEYMSKDNEAIIDHERMFPFQLSIKDGQWQFLNPGLIELQ